MIHRPRAICNLQGGEHPAGRSPGERAMAEQPIEGSHLPFRRRERAMARFRRMKTLQKFSSVHASVHNHSARSATSSAGKSTSRDAPPPWRNGRQSWRSGGWVWAICAPLETSRLWSDSTATAASAATSITGPQQRWQRRRPERRPSFPTSPSAKAGLQGAGEDAAHRMLLPPVASCRSPIVAAASRSSSAMTLANLVACRGLLRGV